MDYPSILEGSDCHVSRWEQRDTVLYALAVGMGRDPCDANELPFVYERGLRTLPTLATAIAHGAGARLLKGIDYRRVVDAERRVSIFRPIPCEGEFRTVTSISEVVDKGIDRGAIVTRETFLWREGEDQPLARIETTSFARGDGGCGAPSASSRPPLPQPPERAPDWISQVATTGNQALLYRLCGDRNHLHVDPHAAARAGFERPILHGMCTLGIACHVLVRDVLSYRSDRLTSIAARFTAPVFPGDLLDVRIWREDSEIYFQVVAPEREVEVLKVGHALISPV